MKRELTPGDLLSTLVALGGAVATIFFALLAFVHGLDWQALAFACGGVYLSLWAGIRLTAVQTD